MVAAVVGVLKAGAGYVPLDPSYPRARLAYMADDAGVEVVLGDDSTPASLGEGRRVVAMSDVDDAPRPAPARPPVGASAPAYVIYTSGSTGRPKGVLIRHEQVLALFASTSPLFGFGHDDRWTLFHSYSFDFSVWEIWGPLLSGGRVVVVPEAARVHPRAFGELLDREGITVLSMVPSAFRHLVIDPAPRLRHVVFGGEPFDAGTVAAWTGAADGRRLPAISNMYGITETTVHVTHRWVTSADLRREGPGTPIGTPLAHLDVLLLDEEGHPVPPGVRGEIHIAGTGLSPGYLGREDLNRARFPELIGPDGVARRYFRSGDAAAWSPDGTGLVFHGRLDDQVQFHGFRVELGEVESALRSHPDVAEAVVVVEDRAGAEPELVAYVEAKAPITARGLRKEAALWLPRHMVPTRVVVVDELPRTASGKLDRQGARRAGGPR